MVTEWVLAGLILILQLATGCTLGADQFHSFGNTPIPKGRWPRLVKRADEPAFFWTMISCQFFLMLTCLSARQLIRNARKPQFDVHEFLREYEAEKQPRICDDSLHK